MKEIHLHRNEDHAVQEGENESQSNKKWEVVVIATQKPAKRRIGISHVSIQTTDDEGDRKGRQPVRPITIDGTHERFSNF